MKRSITARRAHGNRLVAAVLATTLATAASVLAGTSPTVAPLVMAGDVYHGQPVVNSISAVVNLTVNNSGTWMAESIVGPGGTDNFSVVIRGTETNLPGAVYMAEGDPAPAPKGATYLSFDSMRLNNSGNVSSNLFVNPPSNLDAVFFNTTPLIFEGDLAPAPPFSAGTTYVSWFETCINDLDQMLLISTVNDPALNGGNNSGAVILLDDVADGPVTQTVLAKFGDELVPGRTLAGLGTSAHDHALANGQAIVLFDLDGTTNDGLVALHDGTRWSALAQEGSPCPVVADRNWGSLSATTTGVEVNNAGQWVLRAQLNAPTSDDTLIVRNDPKTGMQLIAREGSPVPALGGAWNFTNFANSPVHIDDDGNVYYFATWNDPNADVNAGIFRNDELLVQEGMTMTTSTEETLTAISSGQSNFAVSDNGRYLIIDGTLTDIHDVSRQGAIFVDLGGEPTPCPADVDDSGAVDVDDLVAVILAWGPCPAKGACPADTDASGTVDVDDLVAVILGWGECG